jgi:hypothetical protein
MGKPEGKKPLRRPRQWWVDSIKFEVEEIEWRGIDLIALPQGRDKRRALVNAIMNILHEKCAKFWSDCTICGHAVVLIYRVGWLLV